MTNKLAFLAATALASNIFFTPAFALEAPAPAPTAAMQAACAGTQIVNPDENSTYVSSFSGVLSTTVGETGVVARTTIENIPGGTLLSQTLPTFDASQGLHRSGGSPNIFGTFVATATYSGGKLVEDVTRAYDTVFTYGCTVSKTTTTYTEVRERGVVISRVVKDVITTTPPGLQIPGGGNDALSITVPTTLPPVRVTIDNPNTTETVTSDAVVCNSPGSKGGQWRAQNGYTGPCNTALFASLPGKVITSNSLPPLVEVVSDFEADYQSENFDNSNASVFDDEPRSENEIIEQEPAGESS